MPSDDVIQNLHLILFANETYNDKLLAFIRRHALLASREVGDRVHYHCAIRLKEPVKRKAFVKMMKSEISEEIKGTTSYKTINWSDYGQNTNLEQYICKGNGPDYKEEGPDIIINQTLIEDVVHHANYWSVANERPKIAKEKAKEQNKKGTKCIETVAKKYTGCEDTIQHENVIEDVMDYYEGRCQDNQIFPVVQAVMYKVNPRQTKDLAINRLRRKFFD